MHHGAHLQHHEARHVVHHEVHYQMHYVRRTQAERAAAAARLVEAGPALRHDGDEACPARHVRVQRAWSWAGEKRGHGKA